MIVCNNWYVSQDDIVAELYSLWVVISNKITGQTLTISNNELLAIMDGELTIDDKGRIEVIDAIHSIGS